MNLLSQKIIKELLARYNAAPSKRFGQNFLINSGVLKKIINAANLSQEDLVLEIGPGIGTLTQKLAKRAKKVVAVEKDRKMVEVLKETMAEFKNVEIIQEDALKFSLGGFRPGVTKPVSSDGNVERNLRMTPDPKRYRHRNHNHLTPYKLVANLPYYITSPVIRKFLENENPPEEMILMVQKEVAQRICANPPNMSLLAVSVQFYAKPDILSYVSRGSFWPVPKVDSAILKIIPKNSSLYKREAGSPRCSFGEAGQPSFKKEEVERFFKIVKAGFSSPRKQLAGNLARGLKIERAKIEEAMKKAIIVPSQRAETLKVTDWIKLTYCLTNSESCI